MSSALTEAIDGGDSISRHQITIVGTGEIFTCARSQHLLTGMLSLGKRGIPSGCHGGGCGVCKVKIRQGQYDTLPMSLQHVSCEEQVQGIVLACRTFPRSNLSLEVIGKLSKNVLRPSENKKYGFV